jgi:hypothetical protein
MPKYGKDGKKCQNMQLYARNKMWQKYEKSNKILVRPGTTQSFLLLFFTFHQIWLSPILGDHQPTYFTNLKRKTLAGN